MDSLGHINSEVILQLQELSIKAAIQAGEMLLSRPRDLGVMSKSSPTDVVTIMDKKSEQLLQEILLGARPDDGILGEEGSSLTGTSGIVWVVDPLDGTVNYLYGLPGWAVSIAAQLDGTTVAGCVYAPSLGRLWNAALGNGALMDGKRISCNDPVEFDQALIGTGFSYSASERGAQGGIIKELLPRVRDIRRMGAAAVDLCYVASGSIDGYFETGLHPWDLAAGELIVRESGGVVSDLTGGGANQAMTIAGGKSIHASLLDFLSGG